MDSTHSRAWREKALDVDGRGLPSSGHIPPRSSETLPEDLVPLRRWTARLSVDASVLRGLSERGEFPAIYELGPRLLRVSESAVERWLQGRRLDRLAPSRRARADAIVSRVSEVR